MKIYLKIEADEFFRYNRNFFSSTMGFVDFLTKFRERVVDKVIDEAVDFKPTLPGRTGELNRGYYTISSGDTSRIYNTQYYFGFVEEGFKPGFQRIVGVFDGGFKTGHGNAMFFWMNTEDGGKYYTAPRKPVAGFHMLEKATNVVRPRMPLMFHGDLNKFWDKWSLR